MIKRILMTAIKFYQKYISKLKPQSCRFYPTCSNYCYSALEKYGLMKGLFLSIKRLLRCNPFNAGGIDPLP